MAFNDGGSPVSNAKNVIAQIFPAARVTDWKRDPNSALGRANEKSWHNRSGAAVDVAPIPGMSFESYIAGIRKAGFSILEARDEQKNPLPHTTGPHWHVVIGRGA